MSKLKYGMAVASAVAALVGIAGVSSPPSAVAAGDIDIMGASQADLGTQRARIEFAIQKQECDTLKYSQPQAYEPCLEKAKSTHGGDLFTQAGSTPDRQGSQSLGSNQSQQQSSGQKQGPIDKMTAVVKEKLADWGIGSSDEGRQDQPSAGQYQQGQGFAQGQPSQQAQGHQLQQGFRQGQGGQNFGQQGLTQGQQPQGQSSQGSFQGGNFGQQPQEGQSGGQGSFQGAYGQQPQRQSSQGSSQGAFGQQPQGQSSQQAMGGTHQPFQSGGTQGAQGFSNPQGQQMSGAEEEHMDAAEYYKVLADQQYGILKQECNTLKTDPKVWEQCQEHAKSVRAQIAEMAAKGS